MVLITNNRWNWSLPRGFLGVIENARNFFRFVGSVGQGGSTVTILADLLTHVETELSPENNSQHATRSVPDKSDVFSCNLTQQLRRPEMPYFGNPTHEYYARLASWLTNAVQVWLLFDGLIFTRGTRSLVQLVGKSTISSLQQVLPIRICVTW